VRRFEVTLTFRKTNGDTWNEAYGRDAVSLPDAIQLVTGDLPLHQRAWLVHVNAVDPTPIARLQAVA